MANAQEILAHMESHRRVLPLDSNELSGILSEVWLFDRHQPCRTIGSGSFAPIIGAACFGTRPHSVAEALFQVGKGGQPVVWQALWQLFPNLVEAPCGHLMIGMPSPAEPSGWIPPA